MHTKRWTSRTLKSAPHVKVALKSRSTSGSRWADKPEKISEYVNISITCIRQMVRNTELHVNRVLPVPPPAAVLRLARAVVSSSKLADDRGVTARANDVTRRQGQWQPAYASSVCPWMTRSCPTPPTPQAAPPSTVSCRAPSRPPRHSRWSESARTWRTNHQARPSSRSQSPGEAFHL